MGLRFGGRTLANPGRAAANRGELRHARVRHAGDTPTQRFAWRKTPAITGVEGVGGIGGPGCGAGERRRDRRPQISHAIRLGEDSTRPKNVAIPTI